MGITNTIATIPGIIVPIIVGQLTKTNVCMLGQLVLNCHNVIYIVSVITGMIIFHQVNGYIKTFNLSGEVNTFP
jgi:hypothetical protein